MNIFELVKQKSGLPAKIDELVPLSFIGQVAVGFYRQKIKRMDQLKMTEEQRKATLSDGQDAGEMLLDIEARIGELAYKEEKVNGEPIRVKGSKGGRLPTGKLKHERLGLSSESQMKRSQAIHKHPDIVAKVKAQAKANEDIPTKGQVLSEIKYEKEKKRRKEAESKGSEVRAIITIDQTKYLNALDRCISILPQKPPERWGSDAIKEATAKAKIIIKRLEVFA